MNRWFIVSAFMAIGVLLASASPAAAQCTSNGYFVDQSVAGTVRFQASTAQTLPGGSNCGTRTTQVEAWIDGVDYDCSGTYTNDLRCFGESTTGTAVTQAYDAVCGTWTGWATHKYVEGGSTTNLATSWLTLDSTCEEDPPPTCDTDYEWNPNTGQCELRVSPIIIATGKGANYTLTSPATGVLFDIDGDGTLETVSWTPADSDIAFLALDRNGDGQINSGKELFGNYTVAGAKNGFEALQQLAMETNGGQRRGSVSSDDPLFARLLLWTDRNHNGMSEPDELRPASEVLAAVGVGYKIMNRRDGHGNQFRLRGWAQIRTAPGRNETTSAKDNNERTRHIWDVYLTAVK